MTTQCAYTSVTSGTYTRYSTYNYKVVRKYVNKGSRGHWEREIPMDSHYCRLEDIFADWPVMAVRLVYEVSSSYDKETG